MKNFDNVNERVIDDLRQEIKSHSKIKIAAASFSIYAYEALKTELEKTDAVQFLFTSDLFTKEKVPNEKREFFIPRLNRESQLYRDGFELKIRNELSQKAIAKEVAEWIEQKVTFKSNISGKQSDNFMIINSKNDTNVYLPIDEFTTSELGVSQGEKLFYNISKFENENTQRFLNAFDQVWNNPDYVDEVTNTVLDNITAAYQENAPEFIYYLALYNIFSEFLSDLDADYLPDERTGFKDSKIWSLLYDFQKDAVVGAISKLEKHNGVILADSVGLGKTFSAIGVIKYYESRNKNVLVLSPKRLKDNWNNYKNNYKNNPLAEDRLRYDVLFHTDMDRDQGESNGIDLGKINWGNYDLVVIDESHNFRNGDGTTHKKNDGSENRYQKLINSVYSPKDLPIDNENKRTTLKLNREKYASTEFKSLWSKINRKSYYTVDFDDQEIIEKSIQLINKNLTVKTLKARITEGNMSANDTGTSFTVNDKRTTDIDRPVNHVKYDLIGEVSQNVGLLRKTVGYILTGIHSGQFAKYQSNPENFIVQISNIINAVKSQNIISHIVYNKLDEVWDEDAIFVNNDIQGIMGQNVFDAKKHLYDKVRVDSEVEKRFASELDVEQNVEMYVKLPGGFHINTPVGKYNPDWAIVLNEPDQKHVYFIAETKGVSENIELSLKGVENAKIESARQHFKIISNSEVTYDVVDSYEKMMDKLSSNI